MKRYIYMLLTLILSTSCDSSRVNRYEIQGFAQGSTYSVVYLSSEEKVTRHSIDSLLNLFDASCSMYNQSSLISQINRGESVVVDCYIKECVEIAASISEASDGMYDITVKPLVEAYGFLRDGGVGGYNALSPNIDSLLQYVGYEKVAVVGDSLVLEQGVQIDLNSIAQGYSVDILSRFIEEQGVSDYLVEIGGEIYAKGLNNSGMPWRVGIDKPTDGNYSPGADLQSVVAISGSGLATSGNYRKFYLDKDGNRINHTFNPKSGESVQTTILSATVTAATAALADGYATLMMTLTVDDAIAFLESMPELGAYLVYSDGSEYKTYNKNIEIIEL